MSIPNEKNDVNLKSKKIIYVVNDIGFFMSHRLKLALTLIESGCDVSVMAPSDNSAKLAAYGIGYHEIPLQRGGKSIVKELWLLIYITICFFRLKPDLVHLVTVKPVVYGSVAARIAGVPSVVAAVSGLGAIFIAKGLMAIFARTIVSAMYKIGFLHPSLVVIFQNPDDLRMFVSKKIVVPEKTVIIRGSGVDLNSFFHSPEPDGLPVVLMVSRLLKDKGVGEFVEAAAILKRRKVPVVMRLIGDLDPENPTSFTSQHIDCWKKRGDIEYLGFRNDIARQYSLCNIACLPSYREGLPKSLLEASAAGRAIVTTDVPGCNFAIIPGVTGLLVAVKDSSALADAIQYLVEHPKMRSEMGVAARKLAESEFGDQMVIKKHMMIYSELLFGKALASC